jgi:hypothetical protein
MKIESIRFISPIHLPTGDYVSKYSVGLEQNARLEDGCIIIASTDWSMAIPLHNVLQIMVAHE